MGNYLRESDLIKTLIKLRIFSEYLNIRPVDIFINFKKKKKL
jgi:hypothetical protein